VVGHARPRVPPRRETRRVPREIGPLRARRAPAAPRPAPRVREPGSSPRSRRRPGRRGATTGRTRAGWPAGRSARRHRWSRGRPPRPRTAARRPKRWAWPGPERPRRGARGHPARFPAPCDRAPARPWVGRTPRGRRFGVDRVRGRRAAPPCWVGAPPTTRSRRAHRWWRSRAGRAPRPRRRAPRARRRSERRPPAPGPDGERCCRLEDSEEGSMREQSRTSGVERPHETHRQRPRACERPSSPRGSARPSAPYASRCRERHRPRAVAGRSDALHPPPAATAVPHRAVRRAERLQRKGDLDKPAARTLLHTRSPSPDDERSVHGRRTGREGRAPRVAWRGLAGVGNVVDTATAAPATGAPVVEHSGTRRGERVVSMGTASRASRRRRAGTSRRTPLGALASRRPIRGGGPSAGGGREPSTSNMTKPRITSVRRRVGARGRGTTAHSPDGRRSARARWPCSRQSGGHGLALAAVRGFAQMRTGMPRRQGKKRTLRRGDDHGREVGEVHRSARPDSATRADPSLPPDPDARDGAPPGRETRPSIDPKPQRVRSC
jgi:hypothetical protein